MNVVAVLVVEDEHVVVPKAGWNNEASSLLSIDASSCWVDVCKDMM